jgi:hypothetical protein
VTIDDYDRFVSAELPSSNNVNLYNTITTGMNHGPCGIHNPSSPCMKDGRCSKRYPRDYADETIENEDGYPTYRRRNVPNHEFRNARGMLINNTWVVPHNPYLTAKYNCHINVEVSHAILYNTLNKLIPNTISSQICSTVKMVKYLYKYVYKGPDRAMMTVEVANHTGNILT